MISLPEQFQKPLAKQHLQRRIDLLAEPNKRAWIDAYSESQETREAGPIDSSDLAAAIADAFRRGRSSCSRPR
jgi:hypothetical protein